MVDLMPIYVNIIAFLCTIGAIAVALSHIYMHLMNYTEPTYQRFIVRIIFMVPVYAVTSFLSLLFNQNSIYFNSIREVIVLGFFDFVFVLVSLYDNVSIASNIWLMDWMLLDRLPPLLRYEAWVIYNFLSLCLAWVGGPGAVVLSLTGRVLKPSWYLMTCCLPPMPLDGRFIRRCKQGCLQFVILKPILVVVTLILYDKGKYHDGNFSPDQSYLYLTVIYTISYSLALYALVLFYVACKDLLKPFNPVPKFVIIKSVVFLTYWQGVLVFLAAKSKLIKDADEAASFQDFIICVEMLIAAIGHKYAFPYKEYAGANVGGSCGFTASLAHALMLNDFYHDTVHQFAPTYHDYVLYNHNEGEDGVRKYRSRTFVPTGPEMDAIRKNKNWLGGTKPGDVQLQSLPSSDTSSPKVSGVSASSDNMKSSLLVDTSNSLSVPYDMSLIDIDLSNSPRAAPSGNQPGKR